MSGKEGGERLGRASAFEGRRPDAWEAAGLAEAGGDAPEQRVGTAGVTWEAPGAWEAAVPRGGAYPTAVDWDAGDFGGGFGGWTAGNAVALPAASPAVDQEELAELLDWWRSRRRLERQGEGNG